MAYTAINDPQKHFNTVLFTGNQLSHPIVGVGFQPDFVWGKVRSHSGTSTWYDTTRGNTKQLESDTGNAESTQNTMVSSFDSDGFTMGTDTGGNQIAKTYVTWNWLANGGTRTTFTESGNNPAGGHQANTTAGFSLVDYVGTGALGTVAHGLGAVPHMIIVMNRSASHSSLVYHRGNTSAPETDGLELNVEDQTYDNATYWNDTAPTSTVFTVNTSGNVNTNDHNYMAYVWTEIQGYSKFGSYKGNENNGDGTFVYTGFSPAFIMVKNTERAQNWSIHNNKMPGYNPIAQRLQANLADAVSTNNPVDFLSNGFKWRSNDGDTNGYTHIHIYAAFAESPFVTSNGSPTNAR